MGTAKTNQEEKKEGKQADKIDIGVDLAHASTSGDQQLALMTSAVGVSNGLGGATGENSRRGTEIE